MLLALVLASSASTSPPPVAGVVRDAQGSPLARVLVTLCRPALENDSPESPFDDDPYLTPEERRGTRTELDRTRTDDEGRFSFPDAPDRPLVVRVVPGPGLDVARELPRSAERAELELFTPPFAWIVGSVTAEPGAPLDRLEVRAARPHPGLDREARLWAFGTEAVRARLDDAGRFRVGPIAPGEARLAVLLDGAPDERGRPGKLELEQLTVDAAFAPTWTHDLDFTGRFPGVVEVDVLVAGRRYPANVSLWSPRRLNAYQGDTDATGVASVWARPGTYTVAVWQSAWEYALEAPVHVPSAGRVPLRVDVPLVRGELVALDLVSGEPLAETAVVLCTTMTGRGPVRTVRTTDGDGRLRAELPIGARVWIERDALPVARARRGPPIEAVWVEGGAVPAELAVR